MEEDHAGLHHGENGDAYGATPYLDKSKTPTVSSVVGDKPLVYKISDRPPVHLMLFFGFQVCGFAKIEQVILG